MPFASNLLVSLLGAASLAEAFSRHYGDVKFFEKRATSPLDSSPVIPAVPGYNISMPLDHFNTSDKRMFNNQFFINDTYYKPGGPVILFDGGETGWIPILTAQTLAEWNGTVSAPIQLAKALNGVVIGWEHRYYGYSMPFPTTSSDRLTVSSLTTVGIPVDGAADYKYLTVEQALEDVVFFANSFNRTQLGVNNTVLGGVNATQNLGPSQTPWIWVGGSYPGIRGAWIRLLHPEIFYAVWASSAPVEPKADGSAYYNSLYRALPQNCTADIQAAAKMFDDTLTSGDQSSIDDIKTMTYIMNGGPITFGVNMTDVLNVTNYELAESIFPFIAEIYQSFGASSSSQKLCNLLESFDAHSFLSNASLSSTDRAIRSSVFYYNHGNSTPSAGGIAAANGEKGPQVAFAALLWAVRGALRIYSDTIRAYGVDDDTFYVDEHSWTWQVLSQVGLVQNTNATSPLRLGSKFNSLDAGRASVEGYFSTFKAGDFPAQPNLTFAQSLGGWNMQPSNTMFTNGEFDPWRAFSVVSLDQDLGAPVRKLTQEIPKCGAAPAGTDVFGLLYGGAVHCEDLTYEPGRPTGSIEPADNAPVLQGTALFVKAYNAWLPCFNDSRSSSPPGGTPGGTPGGNNAAARAAGFVPAATWRVMVGAALLATALGAVV